MAPYTEQHYSAGSSKVNKLDKNVSNQVDMKTPIHSNPDIEEDLLHIVRTAPEVVWLDKLLQKTQKIAKELIEEFGDCVRLVDVDIIQYEAIARYLQPHKFLDVVGEERERELHELHAVIMHRGSAHSGHYFAYIKDNLKEGNWECPDDSAMYAGSLDKSGSTLEKGKNGSTLEKGTNGSTPTTTTTTTTPPAVAAKQYILSNDSAKTVTVEQASPLSYILQVMLNTATISRKPPTTATSHKTPTKPTSKLVFKTNFIAKEVGNKLKNSWTNVYKAKFGSLEAFMRAQTDLFTVIPGGEVTLLNSNIRWVSSAEYQKLQTKHATITTTTQQQQMSADEELARKMQLECDIESSESTVAAAAVQPPSAGTAETQWATAGTKKKGIARGWETSAASNTSTSTNDTPTNPVSAAAAHLHRLTTELLSHFYGNYFEFNDTRVTPIELRHLAQAFEGPDSAYLLVYRKLEPVAKTAAFLEQSYNRLVAKNKSVSAMICSFIIIMITSK